MAALPSGFNPGGLSPAQITNIVNHKSPYQKSVIDTRFYLWQIDRSSRQLVPVNLPTGVGANANDISKAVANCSITRNTQQDVHGSCQMELKEIPELIFNPLYHLIQPRTEYYDGAGNTLLSIPRGLYTFPVPDRDITDSLSAYKLQGYDLTYQIGQIEFENNYTVPAGTRYTDQVVTWLMMDALTPYENGRAIGNNAGATPAGCACPGPNIPNNRIIVVPCTQQTPVAIPYTPKDKIHKAINDLLAAVNYYPLYTDEVGNFYLTPKPYYTNQPVTAAWVYNSDSSSIMNPPITQSFPNQATGLYNKVKVLVENAGAPTISSVAENRAGNSAISVQNLGRIITHNVLDNSIPDQATADFRCLLELAKGAILNETIQFQNMMPNPFVQTHDCIAISAQRGGPISVLGTMPHQQVIFGQGSYAVLTAGYPYEQISMSYVCETRQEGGLFGKVVAV